VGVEGGAQRGVDEGVDDGGVGVIDALGLAAARGAAAAVELGGVGLEALGPELLDVLDAPLEDPAEDVDGQLVLEVEAADGLEDLRPVAFELEPRVVEDRVGLEEVAVIARDAEPLVAAVDGAEEELEDVPGRCGCRGGFRRSC
jgi:hypothetical protein